LTRTRLTITLLLAALLPLSARAQFPPAPGTGPGLPETIEAIDSARVTTRILYITAHPDDESAAALTYLARGLHADVALLSLTRGEGGQNALGPEQAPQLGLIRTQELLAAARGYGVRLYFTRAKDFGFSKTPEETEKIWGDAVMQDMVRVIREFRPNIVINGWGGVHSGHGHHQTAGLWTPQAVKLAADPKYLVDPQFPVWPGAGSGVQILDVERGTDNPKGYILPIDEISPLYGKSWRDIGLDAFVNHRTQGIPGFINSPFLRRPIGLIPEDGSKLDPAILRRTLIEFAADSIQSGCRTDKSQCEALSQVDGNLSNARQAALQLDWIKTSKLLAQAEQECESLRPGDVVPARHSSNQTLSLELEYLRGRIDHARELSDGVEADAFADRSNVVLGEPFTVRLSLRCRTDIKCSQLNFLLLPQSTKIIQQRELPDGVQEFTMKMDGPIPQPPIFDQLLPNPPPLLSARQMVGGSPIAAMEMFRSFPVIHVEESSTALARVPLRIVPAYSIAVEPSQTVKVLNSAHKSFDVFLRVHSYSAKSAKLSVGLETPDGITASAPVELAFDGVGDQYAKLTVTPPAQLAAGNYTITAYAKRGDEKFSTTLEPLPTMPTILWSEPAQTVVHAFDINVPANLRVGYISAEGEMIPDALKRLGISVEMLDANSLTFSDLSKYSTIVVGVRAYELRPELSSANKRLLDYVSSGGTLVVQYNRDFVWNKFLPAPYHATIGNPTPRTTDENAVVKFLKPDDRLLNWPNKITAADFQNWVQERGLYYWSDFDAKYTPLVAMHDPGESDLNGSLVYTPYGKGVYIYTGLAFFRELPEGVPGAYRLFVNLLSASQK
jgi:LmbE family N-acetylglucosaminyl deacetylase